MNRNTGIKCIHCGQLIFRKISKCNVATCQILRLNCTKFDFRWGYAPDPLAVIKADYFYRDGGGKGWKWRGREGREKRGWGRRGERISGPMSNCFLRAWTCYIRNFTFT